MSILRRTRLLSVCATLAAVAAYSQSAPNLYLLPNSSSSTPVMTSFRTDPFSLAGSFSVQPGASFLVMHPNGQKLYSVARSGADTVHVIDAINPSNVLSRRNLGQAEAAVITPDGRRLLVVAGSVHILDTNDDSLLTSLSNVGNNPTDIAVSLDGTRAFVLSPSSNRLTGIDLTTNTVLASPITVPGLSSGVAVGPNGYVYVSTVNLIQVIDGRSMTVVKEIQLNARPGKMAFTADGQFGLVANATPVTGTTIIQIELQTHTVKGTIGRPPNTDLIIDRLVYGTGNRIYALSRQSGALFEISVNPLNINPPQIVGVDQLNGVTDLAVSGEIPNSRFLFVATPGSLYRFEIGSTVSLASGQAAIPSQPGPLVHLNPRVTGTPTVVLAYNTAQTTTPGGTYLPVIARVTNSVGQPLGGVTVNFTADNSGAVIQGTSVVTNAEGWAQTTVVAPNANTTFNVTATAGTGQGAPTGTYVLTTSTGSTGGGTSGQLSIVSGQGQMVSEQFLLTRPMTVRVRNSSGAPVAGQTVTFQISTGSGTMASSTFSGDVISGTTCAGNICTATTDSNGLAAASFLATGIPPGFSFTQQTIAASTGEATVNFLVTTLLSQLPGGGQAAQPLVERLAPTESNIVVPTGTTKPEAVQIRLIASSGIQAGQPIPGVGLQVYTDNRDPSLGPVAFCDAEGEAAITDTSGLATCNLKVTGRLGLAALNANVGSTLSLGGSGLSLDVRPGPPSVLRILQGNNQSGNPGAQLTQAFLIQVEDAAGNTLAGQAATWEVVTPDSITLSNVVTVTDANGRVSALGRLGNVAGQNQVRVRVGNLTQTFTFTTNLTISQMVKISGDGQTAARNQAFATPLSVEIRDERNNPVPGQTVLWTVVSGSATLSSGSVATGANGRSTVTATAGGTAGPVSVRATFGSLTQTFSLTVRPPGPVVAANGIVTTGRNLPGIAPCALATIYGSNIATGINGVVSTNFIGLGRLPVSYNNVEILIGGVAAPIFALANQAGAESIIVQVPCETAPGTTTVTIRIPGAESSVPNVQVFRAAPGIFESIDAGGQPAYAAIIRSDGSYVTPTNPARRGEVVYAAITGLGQTNPGAVTNRIGFGPQAVEAPLVVGVNDAGVRIISATYATGMIGVYFVGFEIPADATPGLARSFSVAAQGTDGNLVYSNSSTIAAIE